MFVCSSSFHLALRKFTNDSLLLLQHACLLCLFQQPCLHEILACQCILLFTDYEDDAAYHDNVSALNSLKIRRNKGKKYASLCTEDSPSKHLNSLYSELPASRYPSCNEDMSHVPTEEHYSEHNTQHYDEHLIHQSGYGTGVAYKDEIRHSDDCGSDDDDYYDESSHDLTPNAYIDKRVGALGPAGTHTGGIVYLVNFL